MFESEECQCCPVWRVPDARRGEGAQCGGIMHQSRPSLAHARPHPSSWQLPTAGAIVNEVCMLPACPIPDVVDRIPIGPRLSVGRRNPHPTPSEAIGSTPTISAANPLDGCRHSPERWCAPHLVHPGSGILGRGHWLCTLTFLVDRLERAIGTSTTSRPPDQGGARPCPTP